MNSSATTSSSASGLSKEALGEGEGFGVRDEEAEGEEAGEVEGDAEDFGLAGAGATGFAEGVGEALVMGFTGPVGFSGAEGVGFAAGLGVGVGEGVAARPESVRQTASAKM